MTESFDFRIGAGSVMLCLNDKTMLVPSMVASTLWVCALITFVPWMVPLMMADVQHSGV